MNVEVYTLNAFTKGGVAVIQQALSWIMAFLWMLPKCSS